MRIGIFLHPYDEAKPAGLGRYILELTKALVVAETAHTFVIFLKRRPAHSPLPESDRVQYVYGAGGPARQSRSKAMAGGFFWMDRLIGKGPPCDAYLFNTPIVPLFRKPGRFIVISLDFAYRTLPARGLRETLRRRLLFWYHRFSLRRASRVVAISGATRKETCLLFGIPEERVSVVYPGFNNICALPEKEVPALPKHFFLFVGALKERKNVHRIIEALAYAGERGLRGERLLIVGGGGSAYEEFLRQRVAELHLSERVVFLGYRSDEELSFLYKHALALVFPSLVEGFGFPVLEAFACGTPVITSKISSLIELGGGGAAEVVDPYNISAIAGAMVRVATDSAHREELIRRGRERAGEFSWEKCAREFLAHIEQHP
ncbi:MAG: group 1 glycosyl transferase [Parcubacteria group bacterium Gr01-1014_72]|nr:MAG: group 1 glycosyl transferase [Parcubacteria group bacterium Gr01-1014_72]